MDYVEIILEDVKTNYLYKIGKEILRFEINDIISSHFFDKIFNRDIKYQDIKDSSKFFSDSGTGNIFLEKVNIGIELIKALIVISYNEESANITINFCEDQFISNNTNLSESIEELLQTLLNISQEYSMKSIVVGYEPATDDDMIMVRLNQNYVKTYNEGIFQSPFAQSLYYVLRKML